MVEIDHTAGDCSITGGYVYRGRLIPGLTGRYLFGDFCSGLLRATLAAPGTWSTETLGPTLPGVTTFGEDQGGELLVAAGESVYRLLPATSAGACAPNATTLCVLDGRFSISATWRTANGDTGVGQAVPFNADSGSFWFFSPDNTEVLVKLRDACVAPFDAFWVFAAGLTNVEVTLTVTDTTSGQTRTYTNPLGTAYAPVQDTRAFRTCGVG